MYQKKERKEKKKWEEANKKGKRRRRKRGVCVCVCMCVRERGRERLIHMKVKGKLLWGLGSLFHHMGSRHRSSGLTTGVFPC
jgi:hypothetical protein